MKAVLDTKLNSAYDDDVANRYHFPQRYLVLLEQCLGDWIVFRRPRASGEGIAYFGVGRIGRITSDETLSGHYYAEILDFLMFDQPVPWRVQGRYAEEALRNIENVPQIGLFLRGKSVRKLETKDFIEIVQTGFSLTFDPELATKNGLDPNFVDTSILNEISQDVEVVQRRIASFLVNRKIRDANFRRSVCSAYANRCAITGLTIFDEIGHAEVQAAHIVPVEYNGPDIVQNGIALSATIHWLFDRHLISLTDDFRLLIAHGKLPQRLTNLFRPQAARILLPEDSRLWPSSVFLTKHREVFCNK